MKVVMDSDALVKITRCGAKETLSAAYELTIPQAVYQETVVAGREHGADDAELIAINVKLGRIRMEHTLAEEPEAELLPPGGERDVFRLYVETRRRGEEVVIASDDTRFRRKLAMFGVGAFSPSGLLVLLVTQGRADSGIAATWLEALRPLVSPAEYAMAREGLRRGVDR